MPLIELHEDEYSNYALSDRSMRRVALLLGPECAIKLLYSGDMYARLDRLVPARNRTHIEEWTNRDDDSGPFDIWNTQDSDGSEVAAPAEESSTLARIG